MKKKQSSDFIKANKKKEIEQLNTICLKDTSDYYVTKKNMILSKFFENIKESSDMPNPVNDWIILEYNVIYNLHMLERMSIFERNNLDTSLIKNKTYFFFIIKELVDSLTELIQDNGNIKYIIELMRKQEIVYFMEKEA